MNKSSCTQFANAAGTATGALTAASITCQAAQSDQATIFELRRVIYVVDARWRHSSLWISCAPSFAVVQYKAIIADRLLTAEDGHAALSKLAGGSGGPGSGGGGRARVVVAGLQEVAYDRRGQRIDRNLYIKEGQH